MRGLKRGQWGGAQFNGVMIWGLRKGEKGKGGKERGEKRRKLRGGKGEWKGKGR